MGFVADLREGLSLGIPACCALRWSAQHALLPESEQAARRGVRLTRGGEPYVPCGLFHRPLLPGPLIDLLYADEEPGVFPPGQAA